jgi:hypothetical protein
MVASSTFDPFLDAWQRRRRLQTTAGNTAPPAGASANGNGITAAAQGEQAAREGPRRLWQRMRALLQQDTCGSLLSTADPSFVTYDQLAEIVQVRV